MAILTHRLPASRWADTICICAVPVKVTEGEWWWWLRGRRIPRLLAAPAGQAASPPLPARFSRGDTVLQRPRPGFHRRAPDSGHAASAALPATGFFQGQFEGFAELWAALGRGEMGSTLHFQTQGTFWCSGLAPRLPLLKTRPLLPKEKQNTQGFCFESRITVGHFHTCLSFHTFSIPKPCWEEVVVILNSENRLVHLKALAKRSVCVLNTDYCGT